MIVASKFEVTSLAQESKPGAGSAQNSEQPQQPFSATLLAASKTAYGVGSGNESPSKTGRRQNADPDDAKATSPASDGSTVSSPGASVQTAEALLQAQQSQEANASSSPLQMPLDETTATEDTTTGLAGQFAQIVAAAGMPWSQSTSFKTGVVQSAENHWTGLATGIAQKAAPAAKTATESKIVQSSAVQTNAAQTDTVQTANIQSSVTPMQLPLNVATATQEASTGRDSMVAAEVTAPAMQGTRASVSATRIAQPADDQSNATASQFPLGAFPATQDVSTGAVKPTTADVATPAMQGTKATVVATRTVQSADIQSNLASPKLPLGAVPAAQEASIGLGGNLTQVVASAGTVNAESRSAQSNASSTEAVQPATVQSKIAPLERSFDVPAETEYISTSFTAKPAQNVPAVQEIPAAKSAVAGTDLAQAAAGQSTAARSAVQPTVNQASVPQVGSDSPVNSSMPSGAEIHSVDVPIIGSPAIEVPMAHVSSTENHEPDAAATVADATQKTTSDGEQDSLPKAVLNAVVSAVQNAVANAPVNGNSAPTVHAALNASAKDFVASAMNASTTAQTNPQTAVADQSSVVPAIIAPSNTTDQLAAMLQPGRLSAASLGAASSLNSASAAKSQAGVSTDAKNTGTDQTGLKQHTLPATQQESKASSQDSTPSGDQSQGGNAAQTQNTASLPVNFASHTAAAITPQQNTPAASPSHGSATSADGAGMAAKAAANEASTPLPQPVVNTARLVQNINQSEMRVGMRSSEFGNISINTSATRDVVSAQISLDHGELAKALAAHLPEMQARLGGNQPMSVRIDMNGTATGQGSGNSGGMSNGTAGQSRGGRQEAGYAEASNSGNVVDGQQLSTAPAAMATGYSRSDAHLDIRV